MNDSSLAIPLIRAPVGHDIIVLGGRRKRGEGGEMDGSSLRLRDNSDEGDQRYPRA